MNIKSFQVYSALTSLHKKGQKSSIDEKNYKISWASRSTPTPTCSVSWSTRPNQSILCLGPGFGSGGVLPEPQNSCSGRVIHCSGFWVPIATLVFKGLKNKMRHFSYQSMTFDLFYAMNSMLSKLENL